MRPSRTLLAGLALAVAGCAGKVVYAGPLASEAQIGAAQRCPVAFPRAPFGMIRGCFTRAADTLRYFYADRGSRVISAGFRWPVSFEAADSVFASLEADAVSRQGAPVRCDRTGGSWVELDRRWQDGDVQTAIVVSVPSRDLGVGPFVQVVKQIGSGRCERLLSVPLPR